MSLESIHVESEFILLVLISLRTNDVEVHRSSNNYSTPVLMDLVRTDEIIIYGANIQTYRIFQFMGKSFIIKARLSKTGQIIEICDCIKS